MKQILNVRVLLAIAVTFVAGACASIGSGVSDEDQIAALLGHWEGSIVIELALPEEKAGWLITDMSIEGL